MRVDARKTLRGARMSGAGIAVLVALAGCTTVPESSTPQVVQPVVVQPPDVGVSGPLPGEDPRSIVQDFLTANLDPRDPSYSAARSYLSKDERGHWNPATVTIVDHTQVSNIVLNKTKRGMSQSGSITVTGDPIGTIDETGTYKPILRGDGSGLGAVSVPLTYKLREFDGEWRITSLPLGLLVTSAQFEAFHQYSVYFFDANEQDLVPTPRYTQLTAPKDVVPWLVQVQLAGQPPATLSTGFPPGGSDNVKVTYPADPSDPSQPISIEVPGASGLDGDSLNRLASQIGATLEQDYKVDRIRITDGGTPVRIPIADASTFSVESVGGRYQPTAPGKQLYFVHDGAVYQDSGRRIPGKAGLGAYGLTSVALTLAPSGALQVAGVRGNPSAETLDIPNPRVPDALVATTVHGSLSRPSWAPGRHEVWIGDGTDLERVTGPHSVQNVPLNVPQGKATGRVIAVRISPDGGRVALVLWSGDSSQIYVGTIVRSSSQVSVDNLQPISPQAVRVTDVAWNDQLKLFATGNDTLSRVQQVYEVQCDGSAWTPRGNAELPGPPQSVTAASGSAVVVSTGNSIYQQQGATWRALLNGESLGTNPVYLE
jgi:hypothetical protein